MIVAAFDVDGTLTTRDCVVPFMERVAGGRSRMIASLARHGVALGRAAASRNRDRVKAVAVHSALVGRDAATVAALGESFARIVHSGWLRPDTLGRLRWHQRQDHRVVLVSASLAPYLHPLGRLLGVDAVLCTEAVIDDAGRYTGALDGANCRGPEKVRKLHDWLSIAGFDEAELWVYGDSAGDRELLAAAHHGHLVKDIVIDHEPGAPQ